MKRKYKFLILLFFVCIGMAFLPINTRANEGTKTAFENTEFFNTALQINIEPYLRLSQYYVDEANLIASPYKVGVSEFYNLGYQFFDNSTGLAYFLGKAIVDVQFQIYTTYSSAEDIFASGSPQNSYRRWLDLYWQKSRPYEDDGWYEDQYDIEFYEIVNGDTISGLKNARPLGYDCDWKITTDFVDINDYFAIPNKYSDTQVIFDIPQVQFVGGNIDDYRYNVGLETDHDVNLISQYPTVDWEGWDGIDMHESSIFEDDMEDSFSHLGLATVGTVSLYQMLGHSERCEPPTNADMKMLLSENSGYFHLMTRPELSIYKQPFIYNYAEIYADVKGLDAGVLSSQQVTIADERVIGYEVDNQEIQLDASLEYLVWGTAELTENLRDELLKSPEFIQGDVFWDISFWGDTSVSTIFGESGLRTTWNNLSTGMKRTIIIIVIIVLLIGGTFLFMKIRSSIGGLGGGSAGSGAKVRQPLFVRGNVTTNIQDSDTSGFNINRRNRTKERG